MPKVQKKKVPARYAIGEWFGRVFPRMSVEERRTAVQLARTAVRVRKAVCPFLSRPGAIQYCNKQSGVCSIRLHEEGSKSTLGNGVGPFVTTCPNRFAQGRKIYTWIADALLSTTNYDLISQVGFLEPTGCLDSTGENKADRDVGRIDNIIIARGAMPMRWAPVEVQAVYFSGEGMGAEYQAIENHPTALPYPVKIRRPDFRSSGPKRLMPQLQIKVPSLRRWGKKMAVVVDRPFFESLGQMDQIDEVSNCDIVWFIVEVKETTKSGLAELQLIDVRFTTLERAVEGLTGGKPVSLSEFESRVVTKLGSRPDLSIQPQLDLSNEGLDR